MTELLHFSSDLLTADGTVQTCRAAKVGYEVTLDRTAFHPQGGGQPSDVGQIGSARVTKVFRKDGAVVYCVDVPLAIGGVTLQVDAQARQLHSRLHTAGHLIGHAVVPLGFVATRAHHWPGEAKVWVSPKSATVSPLTVQSLQALVDTLIAQDLPRVTRLHDHHREVSFGDLAAFPCGGTHITSTRDVGRCIVENISDSENGLSIKYTVV
jgi:Ser-tRNA(Ala) deacylase AlaX